MEKTRFMVFVSKILHDILTEGIALGKYLFLYLLILNAIGFFICWWDKHCARKGKWRVPEKTLIFNALCGGALGFYIGMWVFRHKTKHPKFTVGIPLILILWIGVIALLQWKTECFF